MRKPSGAIPAIAALVAIASAPAFASEIVYHPVNPNFGGNPLNGSALLSQAQAQGEGVKSGPQGPDLSGLDNLPNPTFAKSNPYVPTNSPALADMFDAFDFSHAVTLSYTE